MPMRPPLLLLSFLFLGSAGLAGAAEVKVHKTSSGWQLIVDGQPYIVRGVAYTPTPVGEEPSQGNWQDWMIRDEDGDGKIDAPYQSWVDKNHNHKRDANEPVVGDFKLLQEMGCNTIRVYHHATTDPEVQAVHAQVPANALRYNHPPNKALLRDLFQTYGIRVAMGDFLGAYTVGSGADWNQGTDYRDPEQKQRMMKSVEAMVRDFKDEPYILMWILGNENNYRPQTHTNAGTYAREYAQFVNQVAKRIHQLDPHHPVVLSNGETQSLRMYAKEAPSVDVFGVNAYRTPGFGTLWKEVAGEYDRPVLLTEYGQLKPRVVNGALDETSQEQVHQAAWCDIQKHVSGGLSPANALGGFAFEWVDQWWYDGQPSDHNEGRNGYNNEWHGMTGQGDGATSPLQRELRKTYFLYQKLWKGSPNSCE
jgi:hypothetical protein